MSMVMTVLYSPPIPARAVAAVRVLLLCRISRMMIMRVRRRLSESEIEKYGILKRTLKVFQSMLSGIKVR